MAVSLSLAKQHLNVTGDADDPLIEQYLVAAVNLIKAKMGEHCGAPHYAVDQAVLLLAAHWYENREASIVGVSAQVIPFGVQEIIDEYRNYTFGLPWEVSDDE